MSSNRFSLDGKCALVTGASSGLGAHFAHVLSEAGASVVLTARRMENLEALADEINKAGGNALPVACDVGEADQVAACFTAAAEKFGRVDIVVNNAGIVSDGGSMPEKLEHDIFEEVVKVNLLGVWYCCKEAGKQMLADGKGGSIINVSSIMGLGGACDHPTAYQATKGAVNNMTRNLACSWADRNVRVNALLPGYFPSEMTDQYFAVDGYLDYVGASTAMGRTGNVEELDGPLLLLASDAGSYMTGHCLVVDGGYSAAIGGQRWENRTYEHMGEVFPDGRTIHIRQE